MVVFLVFFHPYNIQHCTCIYQYHKYHLESVRDDVRGWGLAKRGSSAYDHQAEAPPVGRSTVPLSTRGGVGVIHGD